MGRTTISGERSGRTARRALMAYGSAAALAAALFFADGELAPAGAQDIGPRINANEAVQGSFTSPTPGPPVFESRSATLDVVRLTRDAVLNWSPYDNQPLGGANGNSFVNFLPQGTELRFAGLGADFTAINRVLTAGNNAGAYRPIAIGGTVSSYIGTPRGGLGAQGGSIWFYSPGGILATGSAAFNVGSLLLSTSDIANFSRQNIYRSADLTGIAAGNPSAAVTLAAGSQVNLPNAGSTLVIFSPTIGQGGTVKVNGSATYASGNSGSVNIWDSGLVDLSILQDAAAGNRIVHTGTTTGPASVGTPNGNVFDPQVIEFLGGTDVGVLLSGAIGYAPATDAQLLPNGAIRLTAGAVSATGDLTLSADTTVTAAGPVSFTAGAGTTIAMGSDINGGYILEVEAPAAEIRAAAGGTIDIAGSVVLRHDGSPADLAIRADAAAGPLGAGTMTFGDDLVLASNSGKVTVEGGAKPILVAGNVDLEGDAVALRFAGNGGIAAARYLIAAGGAGLTLTRSGGAGTATLTAEAGLDAYAVGSIVAGPGTVLDAGGAVTLISQTGSIDIASLETASFTNLVARRDIVLGDANVGLNAGGSLNLFAGLEDFDPVVAYHPEATVRITGTVAADRMFIESGGFVRFAPGSAVSVNYGMLVRTGDDIVVEQGASLLSRFDPLVPDAVSLLAGDINLGPFGGDLVDPITTPIASLVVRGSIDSSGHGVVLTGDAIDATGGTIRAGDFRADVTDAPFFDPFSNDAGLLTPGCFQGSACLGALTATGDVSIGLQSNNDLVSATIASVDFTGGSFEVQTRESLSIGALGTPSQIVATDEIALTSLTGDISLADASLSAPLVMVSAGQGSLLGTGDLASPQDIVIAVAGSVAAGEIVTGGTLVRAPGDTGPYLVAGDFRAARLETGGAADLAIVAGGDIALGSADPNGASVVLTGKAVELLETNADTAAIDLTGESVRFNALRALGAVDLTSTVGAIRGDAPGSIAAGATIDLAAKTDLLAGTLTAGGPVTASAGGNATLGTVESGQGEVAVTAGNALALGVVRAADAIVLQASGAVDFATLVSNAGFVRINATGPVTGETISAATRAAVNAGSVAVEGITAGADIIADGGAFAAASLVAGTAIEMASSAAIDLGSGEAGTSLTLEALSGAIAFDSLDAGTDLRLVAGGAVAGGNLAAGASILVRGASIALGAASFGDGLTLTALSGGVTGSGLYRGTGAVSIDAAQAVSIGSVDTLGAIAIEAGSDASFVELRSRDGSVDVAAAGALTGSTAAAPGGDPAGDDSVSLTAGGNLTLTGAVRVLNPGSRAQDDFSAVARGTLSVAGVEAGRDLTLEAGAGSLSAANVVSGRNLSLTAPSVTIDQSTVAGDLFVEATSGGIAGSGTTTAGGSIDLIAAQEISVAAMKADGGGLAAMAGGEIAFAEFVAAGPITLDAAGAVAGGTLAAMGAVAVDGGGAIALSGLTSTEASLISTGGAISASGIALGGSTLFAKGTAISLAAPGSLRVGAEATAGPLAITAGGDLTVDARATGALTLASTGGSVAIGAVGPNVLQLAPIAPQAVAGGADVAITAAQAITVADSVTAAGALTMTAGGAVSLNGPAAGQIIALTAVDLAIGANGSLGTASTQRISLASTAPVNLGTGAAGGFAVDAGEFARIRNGGDLLITALAAPGGAGGKITVTGLSIDAGAGGQIGAAGTLALTATNGALGVTGDLAVAKAGVDTKLALKGDTVDLDYATAALAMLDAGGNPAGQMLVDGRIITSISATARTDIVGKTPEEISLRLGQADVIRTTPLFRTGALSLTAADAILIQNSGTGPDFGDRRGLSVGSLTINGAPDGHTLVVINGIIGNLTGIDAAKIVQINGPIGPGSTVNGCALGNLNGCAVAAILAPQSILIGTPDLLKDEDKDTEVEDGVADGRNDAPPIDTNRIDDLAGRPMIDDPVTGAGNEDLWQPPEG